MTRYSPSSAKTYSFCSKKYYFNWLSQKKQGWRKDESHPWRRVYALKRVKNSNTWAGDIYHTIIAYTLQQIRIGKHPQLPSVIKLANELISRQFTYSQNREFIGVSESKAPKFDGMPLFLTLFEHIYDLSDNNILDETQQKLGIWLNNTFRWEKWEKLCNLVRQASEIFIEPNNLWYSLGGARISARMDIGLELRDGKFIIFDWKCYNDDPEFTDYNEKNFKHQLLTYALWPTLRDYKPLSIEDISTYVFYPSLNKTVDFTFSEEDLWDYELTVQKWVDFHDQVFTEIGDVEFDDLSGPTNPQSSCPWCQFKAICGEEIEWHKIT